MIFGPGMANLLFISRSRPWIPVPVAVLCVFLGKHGSPVTPVMVTEGIITVNLHIRGGVAI